MPFGQKYRKKDDYKKRGTIRSSSPGSVSHDAKESANKPKSYIKFATRSWTAARKKWRA